MSYFKNFLGAEQSLFRNELALDFSFVPKELPYRENQQHYIAGCIKPLLSERNGKNLMVTGPSGIGKTAAVRWIFRELQDETDDIYIIYVNCWQKNTSYKIYLDICEQINYKFTQNKRADELFKIIRDVFNKKAAVFCFDEIDKAEDLDFLYSIAEEIYKKTIILISNFKDWPANLDKRLSSRLMLENLEFQPYTLKETEGIMKKRREYAFVPNVWNEDAFNQIVEKTYEMHDIRSGLYLMRESGLKAEDESSVKITKEHSDSAIKNISRKEPELDKDTKKLIELIKNNPNIKSGDLHKKYVEEIHDINYKTFTRRLKKMEHDNLIVLDNKIGAGGNITSIRLNDSVKKLTDY